MGKLLLLKDMGDETFTDLIVFDNEVDIKAVEEKMNELRGRDNWAYDDVLKELDSFGGYEVIPLSAIETIGY